jgi:hypothetical protein
MKGKSEEIIIWIMSQPLPSPSTQVTEGAAFSYQNFDGKWLLFHPPSKYNFCKNNQNG